MVNVAVQLADAPTLIALVMVQPTLDSDCPSKSESLSSRWTLVIVIELPVVTVPVFITVNVMITWSPRAAR